MNSLHTSRNMKLIKPFDERMISNERKYKNNNIKRKCTFMKANDVMMIVRIPNSKMNETKKGEKRKKEWNGMIKKTTV